MTVDELGQHGMEQMEDDEVEAFLASHSLGVLGLPAEEAPYLVPMSYGYEGGTSLYFFYVLGAKSRKADLSDRAESASFLVYSTETMFNWRSVFLTGTIRQLSEDDRTELARTQIPAWRPELFETASETEDTRLYEFEIEEWSGIKYTGLPPGFSPGVE